MGAFASMALNAYGITLMSYVALAFSLAFLFELFFILPVQKEIDSTHKKVIGIELIVLSALSVLYFLRGMNIEIPYTLTGSSVLLITLLLINGYYLFTAWMEVKAAPSKLKLGMVFYFVALLLLIGSSFLPSGLSFTGTLVAWACLVGFVVFGWWKGMVIVNGEEVSAWQMVTRFKNKTGIQLIVFTLAATYSLLSSFQLLPPLYVGSLPNGYANVVRQWEAGKNDSSKKPTNPVEFEQAYKNFLKGK